MRIEISAPSKAWFFFFLEMANYRKDLVGRNQMWVDLKLSWRAHIAFLR